VGVSYVSIRLQACFSVGVQDNDDDNSEDNDYENDADVDGEGDNDGDDAPVSTRLP
jgi:hypothetical protein